MNPRTILFLHQAFPGQFGNVAKSLAQDGHKVFALAINPTEKTPGVTIIRYLPRKTQNEDLDPITQEIDAKLLRATSIYEAFKALKARGINPDVIYAHPGWGEAMYVRNVWPNTRLVVYAEWFYNKYGQETNFDPAFPPLTEEKELRMAMKNAPFLQALSDCDAAIAPTQWQKSRFPAWAQEKIRVLHDGLNLGQIAGILPRTLSMPSRNLRLKPGMPIVTFSARHLEPVRGFHYFMEALPAILQANPEVHVIVMGKDAGMKGQGYGGSNPEGKTWRQTMKEKLGDSIDYDRVHFLGMLDKKLYLAMLKLSACHVYLTTPFILSWSFLEAAALGLHIVASDTPPVREFAELDNVELVPFDDPAAIAAAVLNKLASPVRKPGLKNLELLKSMDVSRTLPALKEFLLSGSQAFDNGEALEDILIIEEEEI